MAMAMVMAMGMAMGTGMAGSDGDGDGGRIKQELKYGFYDGELTSFSLHTNGLIR